LSYPGERRIFLQPSATDFLARSGARRYRFRRTSSRAAPARARPTICVFSTSHSRLAASCTTWLTSPAALAW